jgi:hypothetical protein
VNHQHMIKPMLVGAAVLVALGIAGVPVGTFVPFLILLTCPLMMFFMMRGMTHGASAQGDHDHSPAQRSPHEEP